MINLNMSKISPKLIDVENNRIETDDKLKEQERGDHVNVRGTPKEGTYTPHKNGRFPTQLFTNIKNEQYKYVKNIT